MFTLTLPMMLIMLGCPCERTIAHDYMDPPLVRTARCHVAYAANPLLSLRATPARMKGAGVLTPCEYWAIIGMSEEFMEERCSSSAQPPARAEEEMVE